MNMGTHMMPGIACLHVQVWTQKLSIMHTHAWSAVPGPAADLPRCVVRQTWFQPQPDSLLTLNLIFCVCKMKIMMIALWVVVKIK